MSNKDGEGNDSEDDSIQKAEIVTNAEASATEFSCDAGLRALAIAYGEAMKEVWWLRAEVERLERNNAVLTKKIRTNSVSESEKR